MTTVQLRRGTNTIDLYGGTDGFKIREGYWIPKVAEQNDDGSWDTVNEVMTLRVDGTDADDVAYKVQQLDTYLRRANEYINRDFHAPDPTWLRVQLAGESGARQALVRRGRTEPRAGVLGPPFTTAYALHDYELGLVRYPFWETTTAANGFQGYDVSHYGQLLTTGGTVAHSWIAGDVPGRINSFYFSFPVGTLPSNPLYECWAGFRSDYLVDPDNFQSRWDLGDSDLNSSDFLHYNTTRQTGISGAYNSQVARWTPGDTDLKERVTAPLYHMTSHYADQLGVFVVLLRARVTSGGNRTFRVRLLNGYYDSAGDSTWSTGKRVAIPASGVSAGDFYFYPLGTVTIPPHRQPYAQVSLLRYFSLRIEAEVASGTTGNLEMDIFTMIPLAEGAMHVKETYLSSTTTTFIASSPEGQLFAHNTTSGGTWSDYHKAVEFHPYRWSVPTGSGKLVVAAQQETEQVLDDKMQVWFDYYPRWVTMRGGAWPL